MGAGKRKCIPVTWTVTKDVNVSNSNKSEEGRLGGLNSVPPQKIHVQHLRM